MARYKFDHYSQIPKGFWRWDNFTPKEIACRHCGEIVVDEELMDGLQATRKRLGKSMHLNSVYRCAIHNALVGGAPLSSHKIGNAADISLRSDSKLNLLNACRAVGFRGFGVNYRSFLHSDFGRKRSW